MQVRSKVYVGMALFACAGVGLIAAEKKNETARTKAAVEERMKKDITYLASDELEGRGVSTKGINLAADFIAAEFKKAGLKPPGKNEDYFQPFSIVTGTAKLDEPNTLTLYSPKGEKFDLKMGDQFIPISVSDSGQIKASDIG